MKLLSNLKPKSGSKFKVKRIGRGHGSGMGGTSTKGGKGQKARKGAPIRRGFEGGQTPLSRRTPKMGFTNQQFKTVYQVVNLNKLSKVKGEVTPETLIKLGLVKKGLVKILGFGEVKTALTVKAHKVSESAKNAIEKAGGKVEILQLRKEQATVK